MFVMKKRGAVLEFVSGSGFLGALLTCVLWGGASVAAAAESAAVQQFRKQVEPILIEYCYDCHADGMDKGQVAFDAFGSTDKLVGEHQLWWSVLKNVRTGVMPPEKKARPTTEEIAVLEKWIKYQAFGLDAKNPDPGRVTLRRLNRNEYRNTIRDLMGVDYRTDEEFPPDDTGYGFDNIGDVLTVSPLLLEKYMQAAETIVSNAVPRVSKMVRSQTLRGRDFRAAQGRATGEKISFYDPAEVSRKFKVEQAGLYRVSVRLNIRGAFDRIHSALRP